MIQSCPIIVKGQLVLGDRTCQSKGASHRASIADNRTTGSSFAQNIFVPILYRYPAFDALDDFRDFLESITCEASKTCQVRGSNPCRGARFQDRDLSRSSPFLYCHFHGSTRARECEGFAV